jgi:hypothetical protein
MCTEVERYSPVVVTCIIRGRRLCTSALLRTSELATITRSFSGAMYGIDGVSYASAKRKRW